MNSDRSQSTTRNSSQERDCAPILPVTPAVSSAVEPINSELWTIAIGATKRHPRLHQMPSWKAPTPAEQCPNGEDAQKSPVLPMYEALQDRFWSEGFVCVRGLLERVSTWCNFVVVETFNSLFDFAVVQFLFCRLTYGKHVMLWPIILRDTPTFTV